MEYDHDRRIKLLKEQGMEQIGVVLAYPTQGDKDIAIVVHSSVRWLTRDEFWNLMRPDPMPLKKNGFSRA